MYTEDPWTRSFYADPESPAARVAKADPTNRVAATIASVPQARWFTPDNGVKTIKSAVKRYVDGATEAGEIPVLVTYAIPNRDFGGFSSGGFQSPTDYKRWIDQFQLGIGSRYAVVIIEPDALTSADSLPLFYRTSRYSMLAYAVAQTSSGGNTAVFLDAGHSRWLSVDTLVSRLQVSGVEYARGISLNVSNFYFTSEEEEYGERVVEKLPGKTYTVDVSRNGLGPAPEEALNWCNPVGRGLGVLPTRDTDGLHNDANLWIKNPGQSDGTCNRQDPYSGLWFQERAAEMLANRVGW